jgi:outer membrane protein
MKSHNASDIAVRAIALAAGLLPAAFAPAAAQVSTPATVSGAAPAAASAAAPATERPASVQAGGDALLALSLADFLRTAEARSGALAARRLEEERAQAAVGEARARGMPQVNMIVTGSWLSNPPAGITLAKGSFGSIPVTNPLNPAQPVMVSLPNEDVVFMDDTEPSYFKIALVLDQLLYSWGKIEKSVRIAGLEVEASKGSTSQARLELRRDAAKVYIGSVLARDSLATLTAVEALLAEAAADRERAWKGGAATLQDALEARARVASATRQRIALEEGLATALSALEFYAGSRPDPATLSTAPRSRLPDLDEAALAQASIDESPAIEILRLRVRQAALGEETMRASLLGLPDFFLNAGYEFKGQGLPFEGGGLSEDWDYGLTVTIGGRVTLFDSFSSADRLRQATARRKAADIGLAETLRSAPLGMRRLVEAARVAAAELDDAKAQAELARERAKNATAAYANDLFTRAEERSARAASLGAGLAVIAAAGKLEMALLEIEYASGAPIGER